MKITKNGDFEKRVTSPIRTLGKDFVKEEKSWKLDEEI